MKTKGNSQRDRVLRYMQTHGSITRAQAMTDIGVANLTAVIGYLRHKVGVPIKTNMVECTNRYGEKTTYAKYSIEEEQKAVNIMTGNEYQKLAMRTCSIKGDKDGMLCHGVFGLTSEAGEVAGLLQKVYQGHNFDTEHMKKELGDCMWMIAEICTALEFTLDDVMQTNIEKLKARYPDGFSAERSLHRKDGDV